MCRSRAINRVIDRTEVLDEDYQDAAELEASFVFAQMTKLLDWGHSSHNLLHMLAEVCAHVSLE